MNYSATISTTRFNETNEKIQSHLYYSTMGYLDLSKFKRVNDFLNLTLKSDWTREEYLQWRKNWKAIYAELTETIRQLKRFRKPSEILKLNASIKPEKAELMARSRAFEAEYLGQMATALLELRRQSKELAAEAYAKSKQ